MLSKPQKKIVRQRRIIRRLNKWGGLMIGFMIGTLGGHLIMNDMVISGIAIFLTIPFISIKYSSTIDAISQWHRDSRFGLVFHNSVNKEEFTREYFKE